MDAIVLDSVAKGIEQLRATGEVEVLEEDLVRLSPLEHRNVNFLGQYSFALSETVAQGHLRPLRDPGEDYGMAALALFFVPMIVEGRIVRRD